MNNRKTSVITLRALTVADIDDFMLWATDDEVTKYLRWESYQSHEEAEIFLKTVAEKHPWFQAIVLNNRVIGSITLDQGKGDRCCTAELGYVSAKQEWGHGYMTQAVQLAVQLGFKNLGVKRIEAYVLPINIASQVVLERSGFIR